MSDEPFKKWEDIVEEKDKRIAELQDKLDYANKGIEEWRSSYFLLHKRIAEFREALGAMLDYYWDYRKMHGAFEITDEIAQKYQDELIEGDTDD